MNNRILFLTGLILWAGLGVGNAQSGVPSENTREKRLEWWLDARFGMMIHWGAYAQAGGYWKGEYEGGYSEWLKFRGIPNEAYDSLIREFNPVDFDATKWVQIAQDAGMKYMVFTAKHHDGFAMYDSPVSDYDIVDQTLFARDPVGELAGACQKAGIKFGVYYSVDRDWHHPDAACDERYRQCNFWDYPENKSGRMERWHNSYFKNYAVKQITELVTQYPIDILWFDGIGLKTPEEVALLDSIIHTHRPNCLINSRISNFVGSDAGDYGSKGDNETPGGYQAGGWENPGTLGFSYGYSEKDRFMSARQAVHNLIEIVSKGGNYLLNVGPNGKGVIIPEATAILHEMGSWLRKYGTSIYGADGIPYDPPKDIRITKKPHQLFIHVFNPELKNIELPDTDGVLENCLDSVQWVYRLSDPAKKSLKFETRAGVLSIDLSLASDLGPPFNPYPEVLVVSDLQPPQTLSLWSNQAPLGDGNFQLPLLDVQQAIRMVRLQAEAWKEESIRWLDSLGMIPNRDSLSESISWLEGEAKRMIRASKRIMADGTAAFPPQVGLGYEAFWLRDYAYTLEGAVNAYTDQELKEACRLFVKNIREDGAGVDCVKFDGTPIYQPGFGSMGTNPVADGSQFTVDVAWHTWQKTQDGQFLEEILQPLIKTMQAVPRNPETHLVHIRSDLEYDRCPYGFTDVTRKQGDLLFCSLLYVQAARQLSGLLAAAGQKKESRKWHQESLLVAGSIQQIFWDQETGLFRAATLKCKEHDIWGSAFAVYLGITTREQTLAVATYFKEHYSQLVQNGQIRHLPGGVYWEQACEPDTYQNGAFWATPSGWFIYTLNKADPSLADQTLMDLVEAFKKDGACEWVFGDKKVLPNYLASAALPLAGIRAMLQERLAAE